MTKEVKEEQTNSWEDGRRQRLIDVKDPNDIYFVRHFGTQELNSLERFINSEICGAISQEKEKWAEKLIEKLDTERMLPGWEKYWEEVAPGRYVERCIECQNSDKIINLLQK